MYGGKHVTVLNETTRLADNFIRRYERSRYYIIQQAYRRPSSRKKAAFEDIRRHMLSIGGHDLRIISVGTFYFTTGYRYECDLIIDTPTHVYQIMDYFNTSEL